MAKHHGFLQVCRKYLGLILCLGMWLSIAKSESFPVFQNYRDDRLGYQKAVASINDYWLFSDDEVISAECPVIVLCRTNGTELELYDELPAKVISGPRHSYTLLFNSMTQADRFIEKALNDSGILYAEKDQSVFSCDNELLTEEETEEEARLQIADISFYSWGAEMMHFAELLDLSQREGSGSAIVAIIDSGVYNHSFLRTKISKQGYDYVDQDNDSSNDDCGHGTRVAGILADCTKEISVGIIPIRVLDDSGYGRLSNLINAVEEAAGYHVDIINLSLASASHSEALHYAIEDAVNAGCCVVTAAGNQGVNVSEICPGHMQSDGLITVGSVELDGSISDFSNYGSGVDIYCYGSSIQCCDLSGGFTPESGTSIAAPHITALCAMEKVLHPGMGALAIKNRLRNLCAVANSAPDAALAVPQDNGIHLKMLCMSAGQQLPLPATAYPLTCAEKISWVSDQTAVADVQKGSLIAYAEGETLITVSCLGLQSITFKVKVTNDKNVMKIPGKAIEAEAFMDDQSVKYVTFTSETISLESRCFSGCSSLSWVIFPEGACNIAPDAFDTETEAVFFCHSDSDAAKSAMLNELQYVLIP